ncbi:hypothetical protein HMPREF1624_08208 [Sporothrix schenckii ATCC 58251]|uniref:Uncharacterized protein n=1 Tax=Sporothrix schenckii (strain ATCC 58251 / de Perez 2211183) TaxID=1391915 RepID=U7PLB8_SPOS1|nr:hypothetical protein HMPREF1624_08208 [Sporothrix schenckii ATCC 58251]
MCIRAFGHFVEAIRAPDCLVCHLGLVRASDVVDEYGRARIWGDDTKACLPEKARGSLDDTLRHDEDMKRLVLEIIQLLHGMIKQVTPIAHRKANVALGSDHGSISSVTDESSSSSDIESDCTMSSGTSTHAGVDKERRKGNDVVKPKRRRARVSVLVDEIKEQIKSLFEVSSLLRRPRVTNKYLRSVSSKSPNQAGAKEADLLMIAMKTYDERHVKEKMLQWGSLNKSTLGQQFQEESVPMNRPDFGAIQEVSWLCQRLAQANTRRREQLQYWKRRPYETAPVASKVLPERNPRNMDESGTTGRPRTSDMPKPTAPATNPDRRSTTSGQTFTTAHSFSTAAVSDVVYKVNTTGRAPTTYAPTLAGQGALETSLLRIYKPTTPRTDI